ncbi:NfeD family protein [bacterium]|jgi:membrane-bound serine protease (ClpP class)|nr:NfeD family protein [bacterium]
MLPWLITMGLLIAGAFGLLPADIVWPLFGVALVAAIIDALWTIRQVRRTSAIMGTAALIGKEAIARTELAPEGYVFIAGERWRARLESGAAAIGDHVRITGAEGYQLRVEKL